MIHRTAATCALWLGSLLIALPARGTPAPSPEYPPEARMNQPNPALVEEVRSGRRAAANAAWWGFDEKDATDALQQAIDSGAKTLYVPDLGKPWIVRRTLQLASGQEVVFLPGVVIEAMRGKFLGKTDSLVAAIDKQNVVLRGPGATFLMHKADYHKPPYEKAEWRHALSICGCTGVKILGLTLRNSGGDGIYIGRTSRQKFCKDVEIRGVHCDGNNRQGLSVISADNLLVEDSRFDSTSGTAPQAGIDLEPDSSGDRLVNCVIRNCTAENNAGPGMYLHLGPLNRTSRDLSVRLENCTVKGAGSFGIGCGMIKDDGPAGLVEFTNVVVDGSGGAGIYVYDKSAGRAVVRFDRCTVRGAAAKSGSPIALALREPKIVTRLGGVELRDCVVEDDRDRPFLSASFREPGEGLFDVRGTLTVRNPHGVKTDLGRKTENVEIKAAAPAP